jgi:hypothetical protein
VNETGLSTLHVSGYVCERQFNANQASARIVFNIRLLTATSYQLISLESNSRIHASGLPVARRVLVLVHGGALRLCGVRRGQYYSLALPQPAQTNARLRAQVRCCGLPSSNSHDYPIPIQV